MQQAGTRTNQTASGAAGQQRRPAPHLRGMTSVGSVSLNSGLRPGSVRMSASMPQVPTAAASLRSVSAPAGVADNVRR